MQLSRHQPKTASRSPIVYGGGKSRALDLLLPYIPLGRRVVSPFVGGASLELAIEARGQDVIGYDVFDPVANFWQQALTCAPAMARVLREQWGYVLNKPQFKLMQKIVPAWEDPFEQAVMFWVVNRHSFGGINFACGQAVRPPNLVCAAIKKLERFRATRFRVRWGCFTESIPSHPNDFLYLDPPYAENVKESLYGIDGKLHEHFDHRGLADLLLRRGDWVLSYNDCPLVRELYADCTIDTLSWTYGLNRSKKSNEVLIRPPNSPAIGAQASFDF